jgi:hypothetical protein
MKHPDKASNPEGFLILVMHTIENAMLNDTEHTCHGDLQDM